MSGCEFLYILLCADCVRIYIYIYRYMCHLTPKYSEKQVSKKYKVMIRKNKKFSSHKECILFFVVGAIVWMSEVDE